jgi:hypothetical protein
MGYRKVFRKVKMKDLMPANEAHIGYVAHDKTCGLKKYQGSTPLVILGNPFSDGVYSVSGQPCKFVALEASVRI